MDHNVRLTKKQAQFLTQWTEEENVDRAVEKFAELMLLEKVDVADIEFVINKVMERVEKKKK